MSEIESGGGAALNIKWNDGGRSYVIYHSEMVERVARAICTAQTFGPHNLSEFYKAAARAAIAAMREPTDGMYTAGERLQPSGVSATAIYRTMIDEALR